MNKKKSISKTGIYLILLVLVLVVYAFLYYIPAMTQLQLLKNDIALLSTNTTLYRQYLADPSILEAEIDVVQDEIDRMHAEDYVNDSNVSFMISDAIQRFGVALSSVSVGEESTVGDHRVLPIHLVFDGDLNNVHSFIEYFEENQEGSFRIHNLSLRLGNSHANAVMVIYLYTPNV